LVAENNLLIFDLKIVNLIVLCVDFENVIVMIKQLLI